MFKPDSYAMQRKQTRDAFLKSIGQPTEEDTIARNMASYEVLMAEGDKWIGTWLVEMHSSFDMRLTECERYSKTKVRDIQMGDKYLTVVGEDFECGGHASCLSIIAHTDGLVEFSGYGGHTFWVTNYKCEDEEEEEDEPVAGS